MRHAVAVFVLATAVASGCTSSSPSGHAANTGSSGISSAAPPSSLPFDSAFSSSLDAQGARAILTIFADDIQKQDQTVTAQERDCLPDAVLARVSAQEIFKIVDTTGGTLSPEQIGSVQDAMRACGFTDAQISKVPLG
jgi:hypothetical protein